MKTSRHLTWRVASIASLILLGGAVSGCDSGLSEAEARFPGAESLDPGADEDGDGLTNAQELEGYTISVNRSGWPGRSIDERVFSNPYEGDSDEDGLDDSAELLARTHPLYKDSDGDGLGDHEEVTFWGTSPTEVDSDGDAVGTDGQVRPPNPALFDGAELNLSRETGELDVPGVPGTGATSPKLSDTDGDGLDDFQEVLTSGRSPVFAETVGVRVVPTPSSTLEIALHATYEDGFVDTTSYSTMMEFDEGITATINTETSMVTTASIDTYLYEEYKVTAGCCLDVATIETETGVGLETRMETEVGFTMGVGAGASFGFQHTSGEASAAASSEGFTLSGGTIRMSLDIQNTSPLSVRVADIGLIMRVLDPETGALKVLGELVPMEGQREVTLGPLGSATIFVENTDLPLDPVRHLMENPGSLSIHIARYDLRDEAGQDYDFLYQDIPAKTAAISVERFGSVETMYVAADVFTDASGTRYGVTLGGALEAAGIDFAVLEAEDGSRVIEIDGVRTELHTTEPPDLSEDGADPHGYPTTGGPGERSLRRGWVGMRVARDPDERDQFYTDFFAVPLRPGDRIVLLLDEDIDQDGVPKIEEALHGSSDLRVHSDATPLEPLGDGLSDYFEIREGWVIEPSEFVPYRVFSSPGLIDTDGDGLRDDEEQSFTGYGLDPSSPDTDRDGFGDGDEIADETGLYDPLTPNPATPPEIECTYIHEEGTCNRAFTVRVRDAAGDVAAVWLDPRDGADPIELSYASEPGTTTDETRTLSHCFDGHAGLVRGSVSAIDSQDVRADASCAPALP